jgi:hypothetical protein
MLDGDQKHAVRIGAVTGMSPESYQSLSSRLLSRIEGGLISKESQRSACCFGVSKFGGTTIRDSLTTSPCHAE